MSKNEQPEGVGASEEWEIQKMFERIKKKGYEKPILEKVTVEHVKEAEAQFKELKCATDRMTVQMAGKFGPNLQINKFKELQDLISIADKYEEGHTRRQSEFDQLIKMYSSVTTETDGEGKLNMKQKSETKMHRSLSSLPISDSRSAVPQKPNCSASDLSGHSKCVTIPSPQKSSHQPLRRCGAERKRLSMTVRKSTINDLRKSEEDMVTVQRDHYYRLTQTEQLQKEKINELTNRLSKLASERMTADNPTIADLSDKNRPTKIGENFGQLYDDEWSDAFDDLQVRGYETNNIIGELATVVRLAYAFCKEVAQQQIITLKETMEITMRKPKWSNNGQLYSVEESDIDMDSLCLSSCHKHAKNFRKEAALASVTPACTIFKNGKLKDEVNWDPYSGALSAYVDKCVELTWLMCVQDPPMTLVWQESGDKVNRKCFRFFQRKGDIVEYVVWPGVLLHDNGPIVAQGHVYPAEKH